MENEMIEYEPVLYKVYIEVDEKNRITKIFSDLFEQPSDKSIFIEAGQGDRFTHAHLYLEKSLCDGMSYTYKYENEEIVERTEEEKQSDIVIVEPEPDPLEKAEQRIAQLEEELMVTNQYMTDLELASLANEQKAQELDAELTKTNQYMTDLELLVLENLPIQ